MGDGRLGATPHRGGDTVLTTCARCAAPSQAADRFCRGCGLERSALSTAVEQVFAEPTTRDLDTTGRRHAVAPPRGNDDPDTVSLRVPPPRAVPSGPGPRPPWPGPPAHGPGPAPLAFPQPGPAAWHWAALGLAALLAMVLLVEAVLSLSGATGGDAEAAAFVVVVLPRLLLAAGAGGVVLALAQRRAVAAGGAVALAAVVLTAALGTSVDGPGAFGAMLAVALAAVVVGAPGGPRTPSPGGTAATLALWLAAAAFVAALVGFSYGAIAGQASPTYVGSGVLFLLLGGVAVGCGVGLRAGQPAAVWVLVGTWLLTLVAVSLPGLEGLGLGAVAVLHLAAAVAALTNRSAAASLGPGALTAWDRARVTIARVPQMWVLCGGLALAVTVGLLLAVSGTSTSSSSSGGGAGTGATVMIVIVGLLAFAAAFTPTLPWFWRAGLVAGGVLACGIAWGGHEGLSSRGSALTWIVVLPLALVGGAVWGAVVNHRHGATSSRPGWVGPGGPPPPHPASSFLIPPTAGARSRLALHADTALPPDVVLDAVRRTTAVRGNWFVVFGDEVEIAGGEPGVVGLHIGGHCHFRARVESRGGRTSLRVGGMDRYLQSRSWYGFIPAGPAHVQGFWMYRLYLQTVAAELARLDPHARLAIAGPAQAAVA